MRFFSKFIKNINSNKHKKAIQLAYENTSIIGEQRHINDWFIINNYQNSNQSLDVLAVAISYEREGAKYRKQAIKYYESFLSNPVEIPIIPNLYDGTKNAKRMFSYWTIYSSLANLYEKEHEFDKAIFYLKKLPIESQYKNAGDYTRVGDVIAKIDINKCIDYYNNLKTTNIYKMHKKAIDNSYKAALEKQKNGYIYKPRNKKI